MNWLPLVNNTYLGKVQGDSGFGTFANGGNSLAYSNAELYIMGLIDASELATIKIAKNPVKYWRIREIYSPMKL